jgi:hypothetical protein
MLSRLDKSPRRSSSGGLNSPWRTHEVAQAVGSRGSARWLRVG